MINTLTGHIAMRTMELKDVNMCLSFISTIWREKPIMLVFDNVNNKIISSWFDPEYQIGDIEVLEDMILEFLN